MENSIILLQCTLVLCNPYLELIKLLLKQMGRMRRFPHKGISGVLTRTTVRCCNPCYQHRLEGEQMESSPAEDLSMLVGERLE